MSDLNEIVICKYCGKPEWYGEMRWLNGSCYCRRCYKSAYENTYSKIYEWKDLDGKRPSMNDYLNQIKNEII